MARWSKPYALLLMCACVSAASAGQAAQTDTASTQGASKKAAYPKASANQSQHTVSKKSTGTTTASTRKGSARRKKSSRVRGQQKIDSERVQTIQEALIREHYLSGDATGTWNAASEEAMRRYQADHGWQSKTVPDSRALIKLGLGPSNDHLLNPESAMTTVPDAPRSNTPVPASQAATPAATTPAPAAPAQTPMAGDPPSQQ